MVAFSIVGRLFCLAFPFLSLTSYINVRSETIASKFFPEVSLGNLQEIDNEIQGH